MAIVDHLGITVQDLGRGVEQLDPILRELGFAREDADSGASWYREGEPELILMPARDPDFGPHEHGRAGWQHLAFAVDSPAEVDRMHAIAVDAGWTVVRAPKPYPRFTAVYYASFVEDDSGIRIEFMFNL